MKTDVNLPKEGKAKSKSKGVKVDFSKISKKSEESPEKDKAGGKAPTGCPFKKAETMEKRIKLLAWGDTNTGKTTLGLQFPHPVVIDLERGADLYAEKFDFDVLRASTADDVIQAVDWLLDNKHSYRTLVIDPITIFWEALQKKWSDIFLRRNKGSKGYKFDFYDFQPKDWMAIKAELKKFIRKLNALDMNVIVIAREKTKYKDGSYMVPIGETFEGKNPCRTCSIPSSVFSRTIKTGIWRGA